VSGQSIVVVDNSRLLILFHFLLTNPFITYSHSFPSFHLMFSCCFMSHTINSLSSCPSLLSRLFSQASVIAANNVSVYVTHRPTSNDFNARFSMPYTFLNANIFFLLRLLQSSPSYFSIVLLHTVIPPSSVAGSISNDKFFSFIHLVSSLTRKS